MGHIHAEILRAIADGEKVQYRHRSPPLWWKTLDSADGYMCSKFLAGSDIYEWRIAPKTVMIGKHEVPEPCREAPEPGTSYWTLAPQIGVARTNWLGSDRDYLALKGGFVHLTRGAAKKHYEAIKSLLEEK